MKNIIISFVLCIFVTIGTIVFLDKNNSTKKVEYNPYISVKGEGEYLYPYELIFDKGASAKEIASKLLIKWIIDYQIYIKEGKTWKKINPSWKIYDDASVKIEPK